MSEMERSETLSIFHNYHLCIIKIMISWQGEEVEHLNSTLASLRQQLMQTVEDYERARMSLEAKHKARTFCVTACHVYLVAIYSVRVRTLHVYLY